MTAQSPSLEVETIEAFRGTLRGDLRCHGDSGYDDARRVWNAMQPFSSGCVYVNYLGANGRRERGTHQGGVQCDEVRTASKAQESL